MYIPEGNRSQQCFLKHTWVVLKCTLWITLLCKSLEKFVWKFEWGSLIDEIDQMKL
jgi:hypothetical protein